MTNAHGLQDIDAVADALRAGGLASVRHTAQPEITRATEYVVEHVAGHALLGPAEAEADTVLRTVGFGPLDRADARWQAELARDIEHPRELDPVGLEHASPPGGQRI